MEWRCYALAGGVVVLEFYLFLVVFPARCISSISPRFYFRKHAFCFLPLVAILESSYNEGFDLYQAFKEELISTLLNLFHDRKGRNTT
jgi:hypothetical protein